MPSSDENVEDDSKTHDGNYSSSSPAAPVTATGGGHIMDKKDDAAAPTGEEEEDGTTEDVGPPRSLVAFSNETQGTVPVAESNPNTEAVTETAAAAAEEPGAQDLSKNAKKRIARWERKMELKRKRKQQEKEIRLAKAKAEGRDLDEERRFIQERTEEGSTKRRRIQQFVEKKLPLAQQSFQICVDCGFDDRMTEREVGSLAKQIRYCYSLNRRTSNPCLLSVTSLGGQTLRHLQNVSGYDEWSTYGYTSTADPLEVLFKDRLKDVVYLTSDSDTIIDELDDSKIYVIGGIVDRNRLRGATLQRASDLGVATGKLPLAEHLKAMPTTPVLTVNHVFDLLIKYREYGGDWLKAMQDVLPQRKHAEFDGKEGSTAVPVDSSREPTEASAHSSTSK